MITGGHGGGMQMAAALGATVVKTAAGLLGQRAGAPRVDVHVPAQGMNAVTAAGILALAESVSAEVAELIARVTPYAKFGFYTMMVLLALHITEKSARLFGPPVVAAAKALLVIARVGVKMSTVTAKIFLKFSAKLIAAMYRAGATKVRQTLDMIVRIQNAIGHGVRTVRAGASALASVARRSTKAVAGALGRSVARLRAMGTRLKKAHVSYKKRHLVKAEETRVKGLISKVRKSNAPLTLKEKQEYLKIARKANSVAAKAAKEAASARRANSAAAAMLRLKQSPHQGVKNLMRIGKSKRTRLS